MKARVPIILAAIFCAWRAMNAHAALTVAIYDFKEKRTQENTVAS